MSSSSSRADEAGSRAGEDSALWDEVTFLATVPDHLKQDPEVVALAEQFRREAAKNRRIQEEIRTPGI